MTEDAFRLKADKALTADIEKVVTFDQLMALLHNAVERSPESGFSRDPLTGQFVPRNREPLTPATQDAAKDAADKAAAEAAAAPREFKQTVKIAGRDFDFVASSADALQLQIDSARAVAGQLVADRTVTPRSARHAAQTAEEIAIERSNAEIEFRQGKISTSEYLEKTGAFDSYLQEKGIDVEALAAKQQIQAWEEASEIFRTSVGADWPGGTKNRALLGDKLASMGLTNAEDKVAAMGQAWTAMKAEGTYFPDGDGDISPERLQELTRDASPAEILQAWKETQAGTVKGDTTGANKEFIERFRQGRESSGLFGK